MSNLVDFSNEQVELIKKQICPPGTTDQELSLFIAQCRRTGLDPFNRQIYLQERKSKNAKGEWESKKNVQVSIDGFRVIAQRSGDYAGQSGPFWCGADGVWREVWLDTKPPRASKVGVLRQGFKEPLWAVARWESYVQTKSDGNANAMWAKMSDLMLSKVAEALALRKAFPNDLSGLYSPEEMAQAENVAEPKMVSNEKPSHLPPRQNQIAAPATETKQDLSDDPGQYVVRFGKKYSGKTLQEIGYDEVDRYLNWLVDAADKKGEALKDAALEFSNAAILYLKQESITDMTPSPAEDEIPF